MIWIERLRSILFEGKYFQTAAFHQTWPLGCGLASLQQQL